MAWPKGKPRPPTSGRKSGTPNKRTLAESACDKLQFSPFEKLVQLAMLGDIPCLIHLCKNIEPPRKALDVAVDPEANTIKIIIEKYGNKD